MEIAAAGVGGGGAVLPDGIRMVRSRISTASHGLDDNNDATKQIAGQRRLFTKLQAIGGGY
jgi:hypothetical protein